MPQREVDIGSAINAGDGEPIRIAFSKVNAMMEEIYGWLVANGLDPAFLPDSSVLNGKLAVMPAGTVKANLGGVAATPNDVTLTQLTAALSVSLYSQPQGRLTLNPSEPVQRTATVGGTLLYYLPYRGNLVPLNTASGIVMTALPSFSPLTGSTTDTTKNPAAIGATEVHDWFIWDDAGTLRLTHGPAWTDATTRSAGTAIERVNGIWLNSVSVTNGPAAQRGTYVGTTRSNPSSALDFNRGGLATGWLRADYRYWNAYNRIEGSGRIGDTSDSWTYGTAAWRAANGNSNTALVAFVRGLDEDPVSAAYHSALPTASGSGGCRVGIGLDSVTVNAALTGNVSTSGTSDATAEYRDLPGLGFHYLAAIEYSAAGTATFRGDNGEPNFLQSGMVYSVRF